MQEVDIGILLRCGYSPLNLLWYGIYVLISRRWRHRFVSTKDFKALQKTKNSQRLLYAWHRIAYTSIIPILLLAVFTGVGMYKPAQFPWIVSTFGSWEALRIVHFSSVPLVILFAIAHSWLGVKVGGEKTYGIYVLVINDLLVLFLFSTFR